MTYRSHKWAEGTAPCAGEGQHAFLFVVLKAHVLFVSEKAPALLGKGIALGLCKRRGGGTECWFQGSASLVPTCCGNRL